MCKPTNTVMRWLGVLTTVILLCLVTFQAGSAAEHSETTSAVGGRLGRPAAGLLQQCRDCTDTPAPSDTDTPVPPRATDTPVPPRATDTPLPPRATDTPPAPPATATRPTSTPPTATLMWTASMTPTLLPTPSPASSAAPSPGAPTAGMVIIPGCSPSPEDVSAIFTAAGLAGPIPGSAGIMVPAAASTDPHLFSFLAPVGAPGTLFSLDVEVNSSDCPPGSDPPPQTWISGNPFTVVILPGTSELWASNLGGKPPSEGSGEFQKIGAWVTYFETSGSPAGHAQTFKWTTDLTTATSGEFQASVLPFPSSSSSALTTPPGVVFTAPVNCVNCTFTVPLSQLFPKNLLNQGSPGQNLVAKLSLFLKTAWNSMKLTTLELWGKVSGSGFNVAQANVILPSGGSPADAMTAGQGAPLLITDYYFRIVPMVEDEVAGAATNTVQISFYAEGPEQFLFVDCNKNPDDPTCPTPVPPSPKPYIVEIISYHGIIPPKPGHVDCYIAAETKTIKYSSFSVTYPKGKQFCPEEEEDPEWYEVLVELVVDGLNWISKAYDDMKAAVVETLAEFVPSNLCSEKCLSTILDAAIAATGFPPDIYNFDELMDQGLDYLADQAVAQLPIPPEVTDGLTGEILNQAVGDWQAQAKETFKEGMQAGIEEAKYALSESVGYVPDGVPVVADPLGWTQPATVVLRITRDPNVPEAPGTCSMSSNPAQANFGVATLVKQATVTPAMQAFNEKHFGPGPGEGPDLTAGTSPLSQPESVALPTLAPGQSMTVPVLLQPLMTWGTGHGFISIGAQIEAWNAMYQGGQAAITVYDTACVDGDSLTAPADGEWSE